MYYPINKEDRATGFLLPIYGTSTIRGQSFSNAFFWAINRSQDATVLHDWFTRTGQGYGGEYRYIAGRRGRTASSACIASTSATATFEQNGTPITQPARKSFEIRTNVVQGLPGGFKARGTVDYFSDVDGRSSSTRWTSTTRRCAPATIGATCRARSAGATRSAGPTASTRSSTATSIHRRSAAGRASSPTAP